MTIEQALQVQTEIVRQAMASGFFKQFVDLDTARQSLAVIQDHLKALKPENQNKQPNDREHQAE